MAIINTSYQKNAGRCFGPIFVPGEQYSFYMNFDLPTSDPDFANFRLDLLHGDGTLAQADIGELQQDEVSDGFYNMFASFTMPDVVFGRYKLRIFDSVAAIVKCTSNTIVVEEADKVQNTARVAWRHQNDFYGFRYEANPNYYNIMRLPLIQISEQQQSDRKQYRNVTNRRLRNLNSFLDEVATIESYYFSSIMHRAMAVIYEHDTIFMDEVFVVPKDAYTIEDNQRSSVTKGSVQVIVDRTVTAPNAIIPGDGSGPSGDGFLLEDGSGFLLMEDGSFLLLE